MEQPNTTAVLFLIFLMFVFYLVTTGKYSAIYKIVKGPPLKGSTGGGSNSGTSIFTAPGSLPNIPIFGAPGSTGTTDSGSSSSNTGVSVGGGLGG